MALPSSTSGLKPMFFVHIPKTAGTSIRNGAAAFLGRKRVALDYGVGNRATSRIVARHVHDAGDPSAFRRAFDRKGLKFIGGHVRLSDYVGLFDLDNVATFLRDPVQRVISSYRHYVRHYGYSESIETFIADPRFRNRQSRALAGVTLEQVGFVGLVERFDESLRRLNQHFGWAIPSRKANQSANQASEIDETSTALRERILEFNHLDQKLYARACSVFDRHCPRPATEAGGGLGACRLHGRDLLRGWACIVGSERASDVRIEVNGKEAARLRADLFRRDIRDLGLKRSGCAGFETSLQTLSPGDIVRCFFHDCDTELQNSPIRVT